MEEEEQDNVDVRIVTNKKRMLQSNQDSNEEEGKWIILDEQHKFKFDALMPSAAEHFVRIEDNSCCLN